MALAPVWITDAGSLGVVPEGKFYRIALEAEDPDFPGDPSKVTYSLIAGALPAGVQVNTNGVVEGIPVSVADFKGVPSEVSEDTTSKFAIRVIDEEDRVSDRTFTLTISGQDKPKWDTPAGLVGKWFDGGEVSFQFEASDSDPSDTIEISLVSGILPLGLTLTSDGLLSGFAQPLIGIGGAVAGWDRDGTTFDEFPLDFSTVSIDQNYQFVLQVTDGKDVVLRTFEVFIYSRNSMTADNVEFTADNTNVTADSIAIRSPYITNNVDDLGTVRHDNYYAHQFIGIDPNGDQIQYEIAWGPDTASTTDITADDGNLTADHGILPAGLTLDPVTGWLSGHLPHVGLTEVEYTFGIKTFKTIDPSIKSLLYLTSLTLIGDIETSVFWLTDTLVGTIDNGAISTLYVEASYPGTVIKYRLKTGLKNKLPQGLSLLPSGNIVGQVSFKTFSFDGGTTTFDEEYATRLDANPTTFDLTYNFTVEAYSTNGIVSVTKEFTILVNREFDSPQNILYCKAMPPLADRDLLNTLLLNGNVIAQDNVYRADDPNFGSANRVIYQHAFGLTPATLEDYFAALEFNHYNKNLILGEVKTARALDDNDDVIYEVVYSQIVDNLVNSDGESIPPSVSIKYPAIDDGVPVTTVYPNSLQNMREEVVDQIGQLSKLLPRWMLSKQIDGSVLGFTPAWVIAYTQPGKSKQMQYSITEFFGTQLNLINFEIDRYTLDATLSQYWGITADSENITVDSDMLVSDSNIWKRGIVTSFDRNDGIDLETIFDGGACRFTSPVDVYSSSDANDQYVKFPQKMIINNEQ